MASEGDGVTLDVGDPPGGLGVPTASPPNRRPPTDYRDRITIEAGKRSGKPCVRGTRITAVDVLEYLAGGMTVQDVLDHFPALTEDDVRAVLAFAADRERRLFTAA